MYYHALLHTPTLQHARFTLDYDILLQVLVVPFINKQVIAIDDYGGKAILNLGTVDFIRVLKTCKALTEEKRDVALFYDPSSENCTQEIINQFLLSNSAPESKSLLQNLFTPTKPQVFVIRKFSDKDLDSAYEGTIKPVIKRFKYRPLRIDEIQDSGRISDQMLEEIATSEVVLADLSGERPTCYYEAGFAHAIGKEIIFSIQKGSRIHCDLAGHRFIEWETEEELRNELQKRFKAIKSRTKSSLTAAPKQGMGPTR